MEKRYKEKPDKKIYTAQVMKLLDEYVIAGHITKTEAVNIRSWIWLIKYKILFKAYINIDPAFYQKFSTLNK
ncbi:hypothetical protein [Rickettsia conorii]|uniref:Uncharacterized protein n=1 Tax=Rickettsia conorii (strain ATCC VR-613 / Malish 7) TaxID=272944 RepID=Q92HA0_RICCN|nr:hypothetical protein [Rickettsia conorii]AAL03409.1 unknown [Rickettsia conorii str. Malish 7]